MNDLPTNTPNQPDIKWQAQWISQQAYPLVNWRVKDIPSPLLRYEFEIPKPVKQARMAICGLGYYELLINGIKVSDHVLSPTVSQYDQRVFYQIHDVTDFLLKGNCAIGVMLGNGWYNCSTSETWHFDKASWRDRPKLLLQLEITYQDGNTETVVSNPDWKTSEGPVRFDALRNGEIYDANYELPGWDQPGFDDTQWQPAIQVAGPGGVLEPMPGPACRIIRTLKPVDCWQLPSGETVFDIGQNISGWAQLHIDMKAGQTVTLQYSDQLDSNRDLDMEDTARFIFSGEVQTDQYTAAEDGLQIWEPRFTYHGFQYVKVSGLTNPPSLDDIRGRVVHSGFDVAGTFECSSDTLNKLQSLTRWSYTGNFVGIPTDCPHREKNGWTGDAQIAVETGLMNFDSADAYLPWLLTMADTQRPSGQLPGIVPSTGWGYNWGSGPAWDCALFVVPWQIYVYTGKTTAIEKLYPAMQRYIDFCASMADNGIVSFGLGDWCPPDSAKVAPTALTSTGYYFKMLRILTDCSVLLGRSDAAKQYAAQARMVKDAFNSAFYKGDGIYAGGEWTSLAAPVFHGLAEEDQIPRIVEQLARRVKAENATAQFGILGAQYIPRVLAEHGQAELAFQIITQPHYPGWAHWIQQGATTLWENWNGAGSHNHIMFGDISAWMYHYLAGIRPSAEHPGFKKVTISPCFIKPLNQVRAEHRTPWGLLTSQWSRGKEEIELQIEIPEGIKATVPCAQTASSSQRFLDPGKHCFHLPIRTSM